MGIASAPRAAGRRAQRPLVTFALLAYNQQHYIRTAVESAFAQAYEPLEIILSDDCSSDSTFEILQEMAARYSGRHRVVLNRTAKNQGIGRHYSAVMELARGEIVELAAGDDISLPWRTAESVEILLGHPDVTCVSLGIHHFKDDEELPALGSLNRSKAITKWSLDDYLYTPGCFINAPARAFWKFTHDLHGPLLPDCPVEDSPNLFRCLLHGCAATSPGIGVFYRWHGGNVSSPENIKKIAFSAIYADLLNSVKVATDLGKLREDRAAELTALLRKRQETHLLGERLAQFSFGAARDLLLSPHFTPREKLKSVVKSIVNCVQERWRRPRFVEF